jgi:EAL domain-containing protein (putative c-di-GMP-specific phosphodiesterase class I)
MSADIISMAHKIGLTVVAEGVEEEEQRRYLQKHDCDIIQGYLVSKPLVEVNALEFLKNNQ